MIVLDDKGDFTSMRCYSLDMSDVKVHKYGLHISHADIDGVWLLMKKIDRLDPTQINPLLIAALL